MFMEKITELLNNYGYIVLFISLLLELIALPLPGEILMSYCGFVIYQGQLKYINSIIFSAAGAIVGITISYFVGKTLGVKFFERFGKYVHLTPDKLKKIEGWFTKYGNKLLVIAYFIPGVRHITGYVSGIINIGYKKFFINAYLGAIIWTTTFITLGKTLGANWDDFHKYAIKYLIIGVFALIIVIGVIYLYKAYRNRVVDYTYKKIDSIILTYNSLGKFKLLIILLIIGYIWLLLFSFDFAEDYLSKQLTLFDDITIFIVNNIFSFKFINVISKLNEISTIPIICSIIVFLIGWIVLRKRYKFKNITFVLTNIIGGYILVNLMNYSFKIINGKVRMHNLNNSFPSIDIFIASIILGMIIYYIIRVNKNYLIKNLSVIILLLACIFIGVSDVYRGIQQPSGVIAGYLFATLWLLLNIFILELSIIVKKVKKK